MRPATPEEWEEVEFYYNINPMPGHVMDTVQVMYNPVFESSFKTRLAELQARSSNRAFPKKPWQDDRTLDTNVQGKKQPDCKRLRGVVSDLFVQMSQKDLHHPDVYPVMEWDSLEGASQKTSHDTHFVLVKRRTPKPNDPNYDAQRHLTCKTTMRKW